MLFEPLESRSYLSAELAITVSVAHLATSVSTGHLAKGQVWVDVTNIGDAPVPRKIAKLQLNLTLTGDTADSTGALPTITIAAKKLVNVAGLGATQTRVLRLPVHAPKTAAIESYNWTSEALNSSVFSTTGITIDNSILAGLQPNPLVVTLPASPADAVVAGALSQPASNGQATLTLENPTRRTLTGTVPFQIYAAVPGLDSFTIGSQKNQLELATVEATVRRLKPGSTLEVPVNLNLNVLPLPFDFTYDIFAVQTAALDFNPDSVTVATLERVTIPASASATRAIILNDPPSSQVTPPLQTSTVGSYRPTSDELVRNSFFVDATGQEGIVSVSQILGSSPVTTLYVATANA